jgi:hypothetical protein
MPIRGIRAPAANVPPSAIQKPKSLVTVAMSVLGVGEALVLEQRHRHRARNVARHSEARDEHHDNGRGGTEPDQKFSDWRPDRLDKSSPGQVGALVGRWLGRDDGRGHARQHQRAHAKIGTPPANAIRQE